MQLYIMILTYRYVDCCSLTYLSRAGAIDASDNVIMFKVSYKPSVGNSVLI